MRRSRESYLSLFSQYTDHSFSEDLARLSDLLDSHSEVNDWVLQDLADGKDARGSKGMSAEEVLRAAILKQIRQWSYRELEYHLRDSSDAEAFVRVRDGRRYSDSTLQANIKAIRPQTWERINRDVLLRIASKEGIEKGRQVRVDSTVAPTNIHYPRDSVLLEDCVRVLNRIREVIVSAGVRLPALKFSRKKARRLQLGILNSKDNDDRVSLYEALVVGVGDNFEQVTEYLRLATPKLGSENKHILRLQELQSLMSGIIAQTMTRVLDGKQYPSADKVVSIFESHTDVIVKSRRETEFGHKLFLTTGKSNMVIDCKIPDGNPSDASMFMDMLSSLRKIYAKPPRQIAADGGFASKENVSLAKAEGVKDVCFSKRVNLSVKELVKSEWVYEKLKAFRAGIESNISALKRSFGLGRVLWRGREGYDSYVWANIVAYNCMILAAAIG